MKRQSETDTERETALFSEKKKKKEKKRKKKKKKEGKPVCLVG